ncbi:class I SAM-dependent methyltransferase [Kangiella sediminilitoris]|uniref:O-methyltransferase n=1 Tax=Kangiella sediminilitoris TaxID=1144748 RepID=A0A1B3BBA6_9GAMM|nr:class I SAM-dependent methyltransferase [Kangiella sediminilitoris]AOE50057.1 O-methyltransferase [Kangiella sediminilitoris]
MRVFTSIVLVAAMATSANAYDGHSESMVEAKAKGKEVVKKSSSAEKGVGLWEELLMSEHRSEKNKQRDQYRNPKETLEFFGIKPGMTVVEIAPGGGWYTEILSPLLGPQGKLYAAHFDPESEVEYYRNSRKGFGEKIEANGEVYQNVEITTFQPPKIFDIAPDGSADAVVTFRNVHNWLRGSRETVLESFKAMHKALKPNGVLGVVEHRLPQSMKQDDKASSGYMHQKFIIDIAEEAGFKLVATSEINANPKDTADHPKGVWTLPPSLRLGDEDKDKYLSIGESDRMTLKFVKPATE